MVLIGMDEMDKNVRLERKEKGMHTIKQSVFQMNGTIWLILAIELGMMKNAHCPLSSHNLAF